jgi:copper(I)-binding protein
MLLKSLATAIALVVTSVSVSAHEFKAGDLEIIHPYAFETAPSAMAGGGFIKEIVNHGSTPDRLVAVRSDYPRTELHESVEKDGVHSMQPVEAIEIPAGGSVELKPGSFHIMFMGLNGKPLVRGTMVPVTLIFENAGEVAVEFKVQERKADGAGDMMDGMDGMNHDAHGTTGTNP